MTFRIRSFFALFFLSFAWSFVASACPTDLPVIGLTEDGSFLESSTPLCWFQEDSDRLNLPQVLTKTWNFTSGKIVLGLSNRGVWRAYRFRNDTGKERDWTIYSELSVNSEEVSFFVRRGENLHLDVVNSGAGVPLESRQTPSRMHGATFELEPGETAIVYVRSLSAFTSHPGLRIFPRETFVKRDNMQIFVFGSIVGVTLGYGLLSLLASFALLSPLFFYYAAFCFAAALQGAISSGLLFLLFPQTPNLFPGKYSFVLLAFMIIPGNLLAREFMNMRMSAKWNFASWSVLTVSLLAAVLGLSPFFRPFSWTLLQIASVLTLFVFSLIGVKDLKRPGMIHFLLGWWLYGLAMLFWIGTGRGFLEPYFFNFYSMFFALVPQVVLLSLGILRQARMVYDENLKARAEIEQGQRAKTLMRVLSHDINNMILGISLNAELAKECPDDASMVAKSNSAILRLCENMNEVVSSVRTLNALQDGKLAFNLVAVPVAEVFDALKLSFERTAQQAKVEFVIENQLPRGTCVLAEKGALAHNVIANFVSNSIKFSPSGETVALRCDEQGADIHITVSDRGVGIPAELLPKLFDPTQPTTHPGVRGEKGTGYGMGVAKAMVEKMGGKLIVDSVSDPASPLRGTSVTVVLKRA